MEPPPKPWEKMMNGDAAAASGLLSSDSPLHAIWNQEMKKPSADGQVPPPLPPRPDDNNSLNANRGLYSGYGTSGMGGYGSYGSMFGMGSPYSSYGMGSCYGMGGYGMNRYGMGGAGYGGMSSDGDFIRLAEESSRQAFQSIESIVQAFGSVSMMLESTYFAVHSSFRAVLGVADHFSRLRIHLAQILSTLAVVKTVSWFLRRIAYILRLSDQDPNQESVWREAAKNFSSIFNDVTPESVVESLTRPEKKKSSWPIMIFFAVVFGTPWLIWKLLMSISGSNTTPESQWMEGKGNHYVATGLYNFQTNSPREVPFQAGQNILIAPKELQPRVKGWLLASTDGKRAGLVPATYIKIISFNSDEKKIDASG